MEQGKNKVACNHRKREKEEVIEGLHWQKKLDKESFFNEIFE